MTLLFVFCLSLPFVNAQDGNRGMRKFYCEVKCYEKGMKSNSKIVFEFGETVSQDVWDYSNGKVDFVDKRGTSLKFKSMIDAVNYLSERGWVLDQAYSSPYESKKCVKHWILYKEAKGYDDMKAGLLTRKNYKMMRKSGKAVKMDDKNVKKTGKAEESKNGKKR